METIERIVNALSYYIWGFGIPVGARRSRSSSSRCWAPACFLTLRLGFIQLRRLGHGFAVTSGVYDDPNEPGDVSHFQALTTALSATVGIGNIAGVAIAIHWGGPGALFWMWMTALLGMAVKYSEVTLAQQLPRRRPRRGSPRVGGLGLGRARCTTSSGASARRGSRWRSSSR